MGLPVKISSITLKIVYRYPKDNKLCEMMKSGADLFWPSEHRQTRNKSKVVDPNYFEGSGSQGQGCGFGSAWIQEKIQGKKTEKSKEIVTGFGSNYDFIKQI